MGYRRAGWLSLPAKLSQQSRLSSRYVAASKGTSQHHHSCGDWQSVQPASCCVSDCNWSTSYKM